MHIFIPHRVGKHGINAIHKCTMNSKYNTKFVKHHVAVASEDGDDNGRPFVQDYLGEPVPEETFTHSHHAEEEGFVQTTRSIAWELIPFMVL